MYKYQHNLRKKFMQHFFIGKCYQKIVKLTTENKIKLA